MSRTLPRGAVSILALLLAACGTPEERLREAAERGDADTVQELLSASADPNAADDQGRTALCFCVGRVPARPGDQASVQALLKAGAKTDVRCNSKSWTPLHKAAAYGSPEIVDLLLQAGARQDAVNGSKETPLHLAAAHKKAPVLKRLLAAPSMELALNRAQYQGRSPLLVALRFEWPEGIKLLLKAGADRNLPDMDGTTPVTFGLKRSQTKPPEELFPSGEELRSVDADFWLAAIQGRHYDLLRQLQQDPTLRAGIKEPQSPKKTRAGNTALIVASGFGDGARVRELLSQGADLNDVNRDGWSAIFFAAALGNADAVDEFLKRKVRFRPTPRVPLSLVSWAESWQQSAQSLSPRQPALDAAHARIVAALRKENAAREAAAAEHRRRTAPRKATPIASEGQYFSGRSDHTGRRVRPSVRRGSLGSRYSRGSFSGSFRSGK